MDIEEEEDKQLAEKLSELAGKERNKKNPEKIENKNIIANLLLHLDPARMYLFTKRELSHKSAAYNQELHILWQTVATLWFKKHSKLNLELEVLVQYMKTNCVAQIDYYRVIVCEYLMRSYKHGLFNLYSNKSIQAYVQVYSDGSDVWNIFFKVDTPSFLFSSKFLTEEMIDLGDNEFRKLMKNTEDMFLFLYKLLSIKKIEIDLKLERSANAHFKNRMSVLEYYKKVLLKYRQLNVGKKYFDYPIVDDYLIDLDKILTNLNKQGKAKIYYGQKIPITRKNGRVVFRRAGGQLHYVDEQLEEILKLFDENTGEGDYMTIASTLDTEQELVMFYILFFNGFSLPKEEQFSVLVRKKINN